MEATWAPFSLPFHSRAVLLEDCVLDSLSLSNTLALKISHTLVTFLALDIITKTTCRRDFSLDYCSSRIGFIMAIEPMADLGTRAGRGEK